MTKYSNNVEELYFRVYLHQQNSFHKMKCIKKETERVREQKKREREREKEGVERGRVRERKIGLGELSRERETE